MSRLPRISPNYNNTVKSPFPGLSNTQPLPSIQNSQPNGSVDLPIINKTVPHTPTPSTNHVVYENKLSEFESKLAILEEANQILLTRLNTTERNFELQLKELQLRHAEERGNRFKVEKALSLQTDQSQLNTNELKTKIEMIQETFGKEDKVKAAQRERDMEMYNNILNKQTEKVYDIVKKEIEDRYKGDLDNKLKNQNLMNRFDNEIESVRKEIEDIVSQMRYDVQTVSKECSERTHNVSKYIDQQISEAIFGKGSSNEMLKNFVHKLTDQVKTNLISQNAQNEIFEMRISKIESEIKEIKDIAHLEINAVEDRLINKMKDLKLFVELNVKKNNDNIYNAISNLSNNVDVNINFLAEQLNDTRVQTSENFNFISEQSAQRFRVLTEDLDELAKRIYLYEDLLKKHDEANKKMNEKVTNEIAGMKTGIDIQIVNERMIHTIETRMLIDDLNALKEGVKEANEEFKKNIEEINKNTSSNDNKYNEIITNLRDTVEKMAETFNERIEDCQKEDEKIEIKQMMNEMIFKAENEYILSELQNSRNVEYEYKNKIDELEKNIKSNIKSININKENISEVMGKLPGLFSSMDNSGEKMTGINQQIEMIKENEVKNGVSKVIDNMLNFVEIQINKDFSNKMSNENKESLLERISNLENELMNRIKANEKEMEELKKSIMTNNAPEVQPEKKHETSHTASSPETEVHNAIEQILNNIEFSNIYSILQNIEKNGGEKESATKSPQHISPVQENEAPQKEDYMKEIENKLGKLEEKIRNENLNMWVNAVQLTQKVNQTDEIKKIIKEIPPVVIPKSETMKRLMAMEYSQNKFPVPFVEDLNQELKDVMRGQNIKEERNDSHSSNQVLNNSKKGSSKN